MKKFILLVTLLLLCLSGCHQESAYITTVPTTEVIDYSTMAEKIGTTGNYINGTTSGNIAMGMGAFACSDGYIYFSGYDMIYEYSIESGLAVELPLENVGWPWYLSVSGDEIHFAGAGGISAVTKDGKSQNVIAEMPTGTSLYFDENDIYYLTSMGGTLCHKNLRTGEMAEYFSFVNTYFVTADSVYVCAEDDALADEKLYLFKASREDMAFEKIELDKEPIAVCVNGDDIFYAKSGNSWTVYHYAKAVETELPIKSFFFQSIGKRIIYIDQKTGELKSYNWETEEDTVLYERAMVFCILEDRYVCLQSGGMDNYILVDLYTGTTTNMLPEPEE